MEASKALAGKTREIPGADRPPISSGLSVILLAGADDKVTAVAKADTHAAIRSVVSNYEVLVIPASNKGATSCGGSAWQEGLRQAKHEWVALVEADGSYCPSELSRLVPFAQDFDAVCGYRARAAGSWNCVALARLSAILANLFLRTGARDPDCGMKLFRRSLVSEASIPDDSFASVELLSRLRLAKADIVDVGVSYCPRALVSAGSGFAGTAAFHSLWKQIAGSFHWLSRLVSFWWSQTMFPGCAADADSLESGAGGSQKEASIHVNDWHGRQEVAAWGLLVAAAVIFFFGHLSYPLLEPDESRYARIAQEMIRSGDYVVPRRFDEPYLDKPPLLYWLTAASYGLFGVSATSARIVCSLASVMTVLVTYGLGRRFVGQRAAWIGAFLLMLCIGFALGGKFLIMDGLLTCFVTLAMMAGYLAIHGPRVHPGWCVAASTFCGLGVMTKGPLAIVLFLPPLLASRWLTGTGAKLTWRQWVLCLLPGAAISLPWFVLIAIREPEFLEHFLWRHHIERFTTDFIHEEPWWYYFPVLLIGMFPASLLIPPLAAFLFGDSQQLREHRTREMGYLLLAAAWTLAFFSLSRGKLPPYIIPALPPLCLLCGRLVDLFLARDTEANFFKWTRKQMPELVCSVALLGTSVLGVVDLAFGGGRNWGFLIDVTLIVAGVAIFAVMARGGLQQYQHRWSTAGAMAWVAMAYAFLNFYPDVAYSRSIAMQAQRICADQGNPEMPIVFYARREESLMFYLPAKRLHNFSGKQQAQMIAFLRRHPRALVVSDREDIADFRRKISGRVMLEEVGGRGHLFLAEPANSSMAGSSGHRTK